MNRIIYSPKIFYQILLPSIIVVVVILHEFFINSSRDLKLNTNLVYIVLFFLLLTIAWFVLGKIEIIVFDNKIILKKKILFFSFIAKKIKKENIDKIIFTKDIDSNHRVGVLGLSYYLKFDYGLNFFLMKIKNLYSILEIKRIQ